MYDDTGTGGIYLKLKDKRRSNCHWYGVVKTSMLERLEIIFKKSFNDKATEEGGTTTSHKYNSWAMECRYCSDPLSYGAHMC